MYFVVFYRLSHTLRLYVRDGENREYRFYKTRTSFVPLILYLCTVNEEIINIESLWQDLESRQDMLRT